MQNNLENVREKIKKVCEECGAKYENIVLVGATKTVEASQINAAITSGLRDIGENKVQELCEKYDYINKDVKFHFIGTLQKNKVKYIVDKVDLIHSVSSEALALEINKRSEKILKNMNILIEINIANEPTKSGISPNDIDDLLEKISNFKNITVKGLMAIPPKTDNFLEKNQYFEEMYKLFIDIKTKKRDNNEIEYLSMGMSDDFELAIKNGANMIRVGTALFGKRY